LRKWNRPSRSASSSPGARAPPSAPRASRGPASVLGARTSSSACTGWTVTRADSSSRSETRPVAGRRTAPAATCWTPSRVRTWAVRGRG
jgi:hypothetical protein